MTEPRRHRIEPLGYAPALDGIRALAVAAVLLFHSDATLATGGFLGVSVFFTVSGFLVTSLLLDEHAATGRVDLRAFATRRARRLLPAAWACIGIVAAAAPLWSSGQLVRLRGDLLAALTNFTNWRAAASDTSYQDLFDSSPSPLAHFWSLAIEMQFYVALPIIAVGALGLGGRRALGAAMAVLVAASVAATILTDDFDLAYNGTHTRAAELLIGALLAVAASEARRRHVILGSTLSSLVGVVGLGGLTVLVVTASTTSSWLFDGGLVGVAVLSCGLVVVAINGGPVTALLARPALVAVGRVSYGIYLFHWPIFLVLTPDRVNVDGIALFALRIVSTAAVTVASSRLLETPIRRTTSRATTVAAAASATVLVVAAIAVPADERDDTTELLARGDAGLIRFDSADDDDVPLVRSAAAADAVPVTSVRHPATPPTPVPTPTERQPEPLQVLVVGSDVTALEVVSEFARSSTDRLVEVIDAVRPDCPFANAVEIALDDRVVDVSRCRPTGEVVSHALADANEPDLVVIAAGDLDRGIVRRTDDAGFPTQANLDAIAERYAVTQRAVDDVIAPFDDADVPIVISWWGGAGLLDLELGRVAARRDAVTGFARDADQLLGLIGTHTTDSGPPRGSRVLVLGDSTSLVLARALHDADDRLDVLWAGDNGCPIVRATTIHSGTGREPKRLDCPDFTEKLPPLIADFQPDVVVVVPGTIALANLTFVGDDRAHVPGTDHWIDHHDREFAELLATLGSDDGRSRPAVLIADSPAIGPGPFSTREMLSPDRLRAVNEQIQRWIASHPRVDLLAYADALERYEAAFGSIRPDKVHPAAIELTDIARNSYVDQVIDAATGER